MIGIGIVFSVIGFGYLCWALFDLVVYALPAIIGVARALQPTSAARVCREPSSSPSLPAARAPRKKECAGDIARPFSRDKSDRRRLQLDFGFSSASVSILHIAWSFAACSAQSAAVPPQR